MAVKQPSFTLSKWNMGEIYSLKFYLSYVHISQKKIIDIPPCTLKVFFITEFAISLQKSSFLWSKMN